MEETPSRGLYRDAKVLEIGEGTSRCSGCDRPRSRPACRVGGVPRPYPSGVETPWKRFGLEASRFLAVGLVATIVALILFNFLVHGYGTMDSAWLNDKPELAYVIANIVGMAMVYRGTKVWAFRDRKTSHADGGVVAFVVYQPGHDAHPDQLPVDQPRGGARRPAVGQHLRQRHRARSRQRGAVLPVPRVRGLGRHGRRQQVLGEHVPLVGELRPQVRIEGADVAGGPVQRHQPREAGPVRPDPVVRS